MKKTIVGLVFLALVISLASLAQAASSWGNCTYQSQLKNGVLLSRGCGNGSWGTRWAEVARGVSAYAETATSVGPVYVVKKGNSYSIIMMRWNTGARHRTWNSSKPIQMIRRGKYGVIIRSGNICYDFNQGGIRGIKCQ